QQTFPISSLPDEKTKPSTRLGFVLNAFSSATTYALKTSLKMNLKLHPNLSQVAIGLQPIPPIRRPLLTQQHVQLLISAVFRLDGELHQAASVGRHGGLAQ